MRWFGIVLGIVLLAGCSASKKNADTEAQTALISVASGLAGKPLTPEEIKALDKKIASDPEAKSAVQSISNSVGHKVQVIKYCPVDGKRFAPQLLQCPEHNVELKELK